MKKLLLILLCAGISATTFAQRGYVRRAVKDDIEKKQEEKYQEDRNNGEKAVDERLDTWDANDKKNRAGIQPFPTMSMTLVMDYPEKPKNNGQIEYYYKNYDCAAVMNFENNKKGNDRVIMNFKEGKSTILMTDKRGNKTGMTMDLKMVDWAAKSAIKKDEKMLQNGEATLVETSEYKTIEGYKCRKYLYENDKYQNEIWITNDSKLKTADLSRAMSSAFMHNADPNQTVYAKAGMKGVLIQTHMIPKTKSLDECIMTFKNFKLGSVNEAMFSTAGYEITEMPSMRDMWDNYKQEKK